MAVQGRVARGDLAAAALHSTTAEVGQLFSGGNNNLSVAPGA